MLSRKESKSRKRLFAERGDKKEDQRSIDKYVLQSGCTYKWLRKCYREYSWPFILCEIAERHAAESLSKIGVSTREADGAFRTLSDVLQDIGEMWDELTQMEKDSLSSDLAMYR